jgi:hypothetical protein
MKSKMKNSFTCCTCVVIDVKVVMDMVNYSTIIDKDEKKVCIIIEIMTSVHNNRKYDAQKLEVVKR